MKKLCAVLVSLLLFFSFGLADASAEGILRAAGDEAGLSHLREGLSREELEIGGSLSPTGTYDAAGALARLWESLRERGLEELRAQLRSSLRLVVLILFCSLAEGLTENRAAREGIGLAACCTAAMWIAGDWDSGIAQATSVLLRLSDYSRAALPVLYTAAAASGAMSSAPLRYAACSLAMEVLMSLSRSLVLPLIYAYLALSLTGCLTDSSLLRALQRLVKWSAVTLLSAVTMLFGFAIALSSAVAASADAAAVKAARTVISAALPVVGGILADSAGTLLSAASVIRSTAGAFSLIAVCTLCSGPFLFLLLKMLLLRAAGTLAELLPGGALARLLDECANTFAMLLALVGCAGAMLFISLAAGMRAVSGV